MIRTIFLIATLLLATFAGAATLDKDAVIIVNPAGAPVVIDRADAAFDGKELTIDLAIRNVTADAIQKPQFGIFVIREGRQPVVVASYTAGCDLAAKRPDETSVSLPIPDQEAAGLRVLLVPIAVTLQTGGWRAEKESVVRLVDSLGKNVQAAQRAIARGEDLMPRGELVQINPGPNCTFYQCRNNQVFCGDYCTQFAAGPCAYCDRRFQGQPCNVICYCYGGGGYPACPPNPYQ